MVDRTNLVYNAIKLNVSVIVGKTICIIESNNLSDTLPHQAPHPIPVLHPPPPRNAHVSPLNTFVGAGIR